MRDVTEQDVSSHSLPQGYPERIPVFATKEEERGFWDTHDSSYYWDQMEDVTHNPPPEPRRGPGRAGSRAPKRPDSAHVEMVQVMMPEDIFAAVKELAAERHTSYHALLNAWIEERLKQEQSAAQRL